MSKQNNRFVALSGLVFALAGSAVAQQSKEVTIPGFYNPKTHTFQAKVLPAVDPETANAAAKVYTGTLEYEITAKLVTPVTSGHELACTVSALVEDLSGTGFYQEGASGVAKVSGSTATCTINIPYSWSLVDGTTDTVTLGYDLEIVPTSTTNLATYTSRTHSSELAPIKIPTSGAATPIIISATL